MTATDHLAFAEDTGADVYWCVVCGRAIPRDQGVFVHDDIPHPTA